MTDDELVGLEADDLFRMFLSKIKIEAYGTVTNPPEAANQKEED